MTVLKNKSAKNILDYWAAVECFTPHQVETENKIGYLKSIQQEVLREKNIPWQSREIFQHKQTPTHTWVYTVFLGIAKCDDMTDLMKKLLNNAEVEYDLKTTKGVTCLSSFQLNNYGKILPETFRIPDFFISMSCLKKRAACPDNWLSFASPINKKLRDTFENFCDLLQNRQNPSVIFVDLKGFLDDIIKVSDLTEFSELITNTAVIYSSHIPVPNKFKNTADEKKFLDIEYYEEILGTITAPDYNIINSFYVSDLELVSKQLNAGNIVGKSLEEYLSNNTASKKMDCRADKTLLKEYSYPAYLPAARWPGQNENALNLAQQIAVNLALNKDEGIFSVNGPPGTGKTTLLRDIICGVVLKRAQVLSKFDNPCDAFVDSSTISIDRWNYKVWRLDKSLLGHEIVIASTNNSAVENISKEIPKQSEVNEKYNLDYFADIASFEKGEKCWGLGAAVFGNKTNRNNFFDKFWSKTPSHDKDKIDENYGLNYLLNKIKPKSNWFECKTQFLATYDKFKKLIEEIDNLVLAMASLAELESKNYDFTTQIDELKLNNLQLECDILEEKDQQSLNEDSIVNKNNLLQSTMLMKPVWYVVLLDFFIRGTTYVDWNTRCSKIIDELKSLSEAKDRISRRLLKLNAQYLEQKNKVTKLKNEKQNYLDTMLEFQDIISGMKENYQWYSKFPDDKLWALSDSEIQLSSPWVTYELQEVRAQLFVDAMNLHKSFIINSADYMSNNLRSAKYVLTDGSWPSESLDLLPDILASFFIVVPTISTTFASFSNLFSDFGKNSLGYLLIDEAAQSAPQVAVGAIYRAKRSIIVGDPLQIQPVVTIPKAMNQALIEYCNVANEWNVLEQSVQTIADRVNIFGTYIGKGSSSQWIGYPLRVHRRCLEPMFSLANEIAYDNLMIQATSCKKSSLEKVLPYSKWIDVQSDKFANHWSEEEGEAVLQLLIKILHSTNSLPSLYIISPFKQVAYNMKKYIRDNAWRINSTLSTHWVNKSVGTVHTFQGKQAEAVILILGGNPAKLGAINWASNYPNLLNVAITRAKNLLVVVGNHKIWSSKPYFQELSKAMQESKER